MQYQDILESLLDMLAGQGVEIRSVPMGGGGGGLCKIRDKKIFFLDTQAGSYNSALQAAGAVRDTIADLEAVFIKPAVRDFLDKTARSD